MSFKVAMGHIWRESRARHGRQPATPRTVARSPPRLDAFTASAGLV